MMMTVVTEDVDGHVGEEREEEEEQEDEEELVLNTQRATRGHRRLILVDEDDAEQDEEQGSTHARGDARDSRAGDDGSDEDSDGATPCNTQPHDADASDSATAISPRRRSQRLKQKQHQNDGELWVRALRRTRRSLLNEEDDISGNNSSNDNADAAGLDRDDASAASSVSGPTSTRTRKMKPVRRQHQHQRAPDTGTQAAPTPSLSSASSSLPSSSARPLTQQVLSWACDVPASSSSSPAQPRRERRRLRRSGHTELREAPGLRRTNNFITVFNSYNKDTYQHLDETSSLDSFIVNSDEIESEEDDNEGDEESSDAGGSKDRNAGGKETALEAQAANKPRVVFYSSSDDDDDDDDDHRRGRRRGGGGRSRRRKRRGKADREPRRRTTSGLEEDSEARGGKTRKDNSSDLINSGADGDDDNGGGEGDGAIEERGDEVGKQGLRRGRSGINHNSNSGNGDDDDGDDDDDVNVIAMIKRNKALAPPTPTKATHQSPRRGLRKRATGQLLSSSEDEDDDDGDDDSDGNEHGSQQRRPLTQSQSDDDGGDVEALEWTPRSQRLRRRLSAEKQARKRAKLLLTREGRDMMLNSDDEDDVPTTAATSSRNISSSRGSGGTIAAPVVGSPPRRAYTQPTAAITTTARSPILTQTDISSGFASQPTPSPFTSPTSASASVGASRGVIVIDGYRNPRVMRGRRRSAAAAAATSSRGSSSVAAGARRAGRRGGSRQQRRLDVYLSQDAQSTSQLHAQEQQRHYASQAGHDGSLATVASSSAHSRGTRGSDDGVNTAAADDDDFIAEEVELDDVNCICGATSRRNYDGLWVQCCNEVCGRWQHAACFGYKRKDQVPRRHMCHECRARADELRRQEEEEQEQRRVHVKPSRLIDSDSDSDEGDDESSGGDGGGGGCGGDDDGGNAAQDSASARGAGAGKTHPQTGETRHSASSTGACGQGRKFTALDVFAAVRKGNSTRLKAALDSGVDVDSLDVSSSTKTPLLIAAELGSVAIIKLLLQSNADVSRVDLGNNSALALAVANGHYKAAKLLLPLTSNLDQLTDKNETITHLAAVHESAACLDLLLKTASAHRHLKLRDVDDLTPLMRAALHGSVACMQRLLPLEDAPEEMLDDSGATLLHLAAEGGSHACVRLCLQALPSSFVNKADSNGWSPSLYAANSGKEAALALLVRCGAVVEWRDEQGSTALHLAALGGHTECVRLLLRQGHRVDVTDSSGWPPLMYADFTAKFDCVMALIRPKPEQLGVLTNLLRTRDLEGRRRIEERVASIVTAIATQDEYYQYINQFIGENIHLLDESLDLFLRQKGLLTLDNKCKWFRRKLQSLRQDLRSFSSTVSFEVSREDVFLSFWACLGESSGDQLLCADVHVQFARESGILLGPLREAFDLLGPSIVQKDRRLFRMCNEGKGLVAPEACFDAQGTPGASPLNILNKSAQLEFVGRMMGFALIHQLHLRLPMPRYIASQLLEEDREPTFPDDAMEVDEAVANSLKWIQDNDIDAAGLDITYSRDVVTRHGMHITIPLREDVPKDAPVTEENKREFVRDVTRFLTRDSIAHEVACLRRGLVSVVPSHLLEAFQPQELTLMLCGRTTLDVREWQQFTRYSGYTRDDKVIRWLWKVVESMSDEEKTLFLQFVTGSTILPPGGFKNLQGLSGPTPFAISRGQDTSRLPTASTCFNLLVLPPYETFSVLRDRVLVAVRFGAQGFTFA